VIKTKISKNVLFVGLVSFFNDISSEMVCSLISIFLTTVLGVPKIAGLLWSYISVQAPFLFGGIMGLFVGAAFLMI